MGDETTKRSIDKSLAFQAVESAGMGIWQLDLESQKVLMSDRLYDITGVPRDRVVYFPTLAEWVHPEDYPAVQGSVGRALEEGGGGCKEKLSRAAVIFSLFDALRPARIHGFALGPISLPI